MKLVELLPAWTKPTLCKTFVPHKKTLYLLILQVVGKRRCLVGREGMEDQQCLVGAVSTNHMQETYESPWWRHYTPCCQLIDNNRRSIGDGLGAISVRTVRTWCKSETLKNVCITTKRRVEWRAYRAFPSYQFNWWQNTVLHVRAERKWR